MIRSRLMPRACAAATYSWRLMASTMPRMVRARPAQPMKARMTTIARYTCWLGIVVGKIPRRAMMR